ncbi:MAG: bifunctional diaminohydroxyphosphoribosylaminopyrimidine deaminase/5-amino-6-(5-phosphoribosylamino)uracil reductase RibD [Lachnospiraceae bacterium]|nr:bifunctional diaminohydroxyphosphoribosylaminopyrimidine deaminase/5-amino-6-(5-phosphoribosylamino)uracil reductase RibD [Lachnospiraceae bacterium]
MEEKYMKQAIALAKKGAGYVNPNPCVGAVIVKEGKIIGAGYHVAYGLAHAERVALAHCKESSKGAEMYVTLEPCCFYGKTPPCTEAIIESGIRKVYVGSTDPNPKVAGKGLAMLQEQGIEVEVGLLKEECEEMNRHFFHYIETKTPYVIMKYAMTMDGKIATRMGESKWITGKAARSKVHRDRHRYMGIMVGVGTILADDPSLNCRLETKEENPKPCQPIRIICDSNLRTPLEAKVVTSARAQITILATACRDKKRWQAYQERGCEILLLPKEKNHINLKELMKELGKRGMDSVMLEGGRSLNGSFMDMGLVNRLQVYIGGKVFGANQALSPIGGVGIDAPNQSLYLSAPKVTVLEEDVLIEREVISCLRE